MSKLPFPIQSEPRKAYFSTAARMAKLLGRDSVADPIIALLELIKNSYDADATQVIITFENMRQENSKIIIADNGLGMTEEDIEKKWMRAATNNKERETITPELRRRKIGEKGVGRFATERLAKKIILVSNPYKKTKGYGLIINWSDFDKNPGDDFEKIPNKLYTFNKLKKERGVTIYLENLNEKWNGDKIKRFRDDASLIIPPIGGPQKFSVNIKADEFERYSGKIKSSFLKRADYVFSGRLEKNGTIHYLFKINEGKTYKDKDKISQFSCGPTEFQLYFYYLGPSSYIPKKITPPNFELRKSVLQDFSGIKLYRDNFRIKPFGDPGNDWLGINSERINDPANYPSNNQLFGFIKLKKEENKGINDTTSRENIINNTEFLDLKRFMKGSLKFFAKKRGEIEGKYKKAKLRTKTKQKIVKKKSLIRESFRKAKGKPQQFPQDLIDKMPSQVTYILG